MNSPYPGYSPSYKLVDRTGKYHRNCLVLEVLSLDKLSDAEITLLEEQLSAHVNTICQKMQNIEKTEIISPNRFDKVLREGLRL